MVVSCAHSQAQRTQSEGQGYFTDKILQATALGERGWGLLNVAVGVCRNFAWLLHMRLIMWIKLLINTDYRKTTGRVEKMNRGSFHSFSSLW